MGSEDGTVVFIGSCARMREVRARIRIASRHEETVLVTGETGTGKEPVSRLIHQGSKRAGRLQAVNVAAINRNLLEAELFGAEKGAYESPASRLP